MSTENNNQEKTNQNTDDANQHDDDFLAAFAEFNGEEPITEEDDGDDDFAQAVEDEIDKPAGGLDADTLDGGTRKVEEEQSNKQADNKNEDIFAGLNEEQKAEVERIRSEAALWRHKHQSDAGRVSAFQRKVDALQKELSSKKGGKNPSQAEIADAISGSDEDWADFEAEYPAVAKVINKRLNDIEGNLKTQLQPLMDKAVREEEGNEVATLTKPTNEGGYGHPDYVDIVNSRHFNEWMAVQHPNIQTLYMSDSAADAAYMLDVYKTTSGYKGAHDNTPAGDNGNHDSGNGNRQRDAGEAERNKRRERLEANKSVKSGGSAPAAIANDDFEASFNAFAHNR